MTFVIKIQGAAKGYLLEEIGKEVVKFVKKLQEREDINLWEAGVNYQDTLSTPKE